ncbi:MAG: response regulator transcription factor [Chitinophagaceae bacterium]|nr:MAG: response regulator transcription factor [Chitinophagaceae bacterium]
MIRTAILDDEPLAIELLAGYVQNTDGLELVLASTDPFAVLRSVQAGEIDLLLLDVQMPALTGLQFLRIAGGQCRVILTTAYPDYALEGYELSVVDYLLKPIAPERFAKAIEKVKGMQPSARGGDARDHIFLKSEHRLVRIGFDEIVFVEALRDYIAVHRSEGPKVLSLEPLRVLEELLPPARFLRIHKSYLVALDKVRYIEKNCVVIGDRSLPIGPTYKEVVSRITER